MPLCAPCEHTFKPVLPGDSLVVDQELGPSRLRDHGSISMVISVVVSVVVSGSISGAALHFLLPTGHENILVTLLCQIVDQDAV